MWGGMAPAEKNIGVRLSVFYAAFFAVIGVHLPFWPVWLTSRGVTPGEIGVLVAIGISVKVVGNPLIAHIADRRGERRRVIVVLAALAVATFSLFHGAHGFWPILAISIPFFLAWSAIMPLGENLVLLSARQHGLDYGRIRLWGSLAFIATSVGIGRALSGRSEDMIYWVVLAAVAGTFAACLFLPDTRPPVSERPRFPMVQVLRERGFLVFLVATALIQGSHGVYYAFGTLHWRAAGHADDVIGLLWAEGVVAEVALFIIGATLVRRLGPVTLIALGGLAGAVRWTVLGLSDDLAVLVIVQALHAFTFGATHLGAMHFITRTVPPALSATAQGLYSAAVMGIGSGLSILASGALYGAFGGRAYLAMAGLGIAGAACALLMGRPSAPPPPSDRDPRKRSPSAT
jgi:MFS transporter, PPP family, 3-phenylpropionic acid transporter